jgi:hypothetical protein
MQNLLVGLIVFAVLVWLGIRLFRALRSPSCSCGSCPACGGKDCGQPELSADTKEAARQQPPHV